MKTVSKAKANAVLNSVKKAFPEYSSPYAAPRPPSLIKDWSGNGQWAIVWEEGPFEWVYQYIDMASGYDAVDEEFGFQRKPIKPIKSVYCEPYYSFAMIIYPEG